MQYQIIPENKSTKRRSKHDIFPEKYHLELQNNTSNFKSEWTNTINILNFNEVHLSFPIEEKIVKEELPIHPWIEDKPLFTEYKKKRITSDFNNNNNNNNNNNTNLDVDTHTNLNNGNAILNLNLHPKKIEIQQKKKMENQVAKIYEQKSAIIYSNFISSFSFSSYLNNSIIPKQVFMCWSSLSLPSKMMEVIQINKELNPEFTFHIYDDIMCKEFIENHFEKDVVYAFEKLIPGAYKADLWRLCVLFINGGIYLDIKFKCINGFTFSNVLDKEYFTLDIPSLNWTNTNTMHGIYNGFMVCKRNNLFLWKCICKIVQNVKNLEYGISCLFPTGPGLLGDIYFSNSNSNSNSNSEFIHKLNSEFDCVFSKNIKNIVFRNTAILEIYPEYRQDQQKESTLYYSILWNKRRIYNPDITFSDFDFKVGNENENENENTEEINIEKSLIPLKIYQTWYTKDLPELLQKNMDMLKKQNPEFKFFLFDDNDCREFIQQYFDISVLEAFDKLIPGAYKADLFRYCVLYIHGGIYLDIKYYGIYGFKFITLTDTEYLVWDLPISGRGIYNALMICKAGNQLLWKAIQTIVENVSNSFYGTSTLEPTGPILLKKLIETNKDILSTTTKIELIHKEIYISDHNNDYKIAYFIYHKNIPILTFSDKYRDLQNELFQNIGSKPYFILWKNRNIYKS